MKPTPADWPRFASAVFYRDAAAAIDWLCGAFGFEVRIKVEGDNGRIEHSELTYGEGLIMIGQEDPESARSWKARMRSPASLDGAGTRMAGSDAIDTFFRLFGDSDGDGHVDLQDLLHFAGTFGKHAGDPGYLWYFDYDYDGSVASATCSSCCAGSAGSRS